MIAGVLAGLSALFASLVLRVAFGVPLPIDLVSDRLLPFVPVEAFVPSLGVVGGPVLAKQLAFYSSFLVLIGLGVSASRGYGRLSRRRLPLLAAAAVVAWVVAVAALWPTLASNYDGAPPGEARILSAAALAVIVALFAVVLDLARRYR